jgi:hypothetical protein
MVARDVCNNAASITQLDGPIVFTSDQGVMLIDGAEVVNISRMLGGPMTDMDTLPSLSEAMDAAQASHLKEVVRNMVAFDEYLKNSIISFDYAHRRLLVLNENMPYAYQYGLRSNLWTMITSDYVNTTNNYPYSYLTDSEGKVSNLSDIIPADDLRLVRGLIITRAIKLDGPDILKTVSAVAHKGQILPSRVAQVLYASRDYMQFQPVASSADAHIRRLHGTPYKSFRLLVMPTLSQKETLSKTVLNFEIKYTNKAR